MAEELQGLLERIQNEAVTKAERQAEEMLAKAKEKAAGMVKDAEQKAKQLLEKADKDAQAYTERSKKTLEQAGRDLIITVGSGVEALFARLVRESLDKAMSGDVIAEMLGAIVKNSGADSAVISVSEADAKKVTDFFMAKFAEAVKKGGVVIQTDNEIVKGFTVGLKGRDVYTDFTAPAIAEALMKFLRPQLAEIVREAAKPKK